MAEQWRRAQRGADRPIPTSARAAVPRARLALASLATAAALLGAGPALAQTPPTAGAPPAASDQAGYQQEFNLAGRRLAPTGEARYWILKPGYQAVLTSPDTTLTVRVLDETREVAGVTTRVVEEREVKDGQLHEVARNFYAIDPQTGDAFYFGEEVDFYENGRVVDHAGSWLAGGNNRPGLIMAGAPRVGMKYYQEVAPGAAQDRAEVISTTGRCTVPAGTFESCLVTRETTPLEPDVAEEKVYAPGIGLVQDKDLRLVRYGYVSGAAAPSQLPAALPRTGQAAPVPLAALAGALALLGAGWRVRAGRALGRTRDDRRPTA
jgi:hypothetical protein